MLSDDIGLDFEIETFGDNIPANGFDLAEIDFSSAPGSNDILLQLQQANVGGAYAGISTGNNAAYGSEAQSKKKQLQDAGIRALLDATSAQNGIDYETLAEYADILFEKTTHLRQNAETLQQYLDNEEDRVKALEIPEKQKRAYLERIDALRDKTRDLQRDIDETQENIKSSRKQIEALTEGFSPEEQETFANLTQLGDRLITVEHAVPGEPPHAHVVYSEDGKYYIKHGDEKIYIDETNEIKWQRKSGEKFGNEAPEDAQQFEENYKTWVDFCKEKGLSDDDIKNLDNAARTLSLQGKWVAKMERDLRAVEQELEDIRSGITTLEAKARQDKETELENKITEIKENLSAASTNQAESTETLKEYFTRLLQDTKDKNKELQARADAGDEAAREELNQSVEETVAVAQEAEEQGIDVPDDYLSSKVEYQEPSPLILKEDFNQQNAEYSPVPQPEKSDFHQTFTGAHDHTRTEPYSPAEPQNNADMAFKR